MNLKEIAIKYLKENGYDGLWCENCACELSDLMPCDDWISADCQAGYKTVYDKECPCGEGCDWHIGLKKPEVSDG